MFLHVCVCPQGMGPWSGGYLVQGVPSPGGCWSGECLVLGGVPGPRGVPDPGRVPALGGVPGPIGMETSPPMATTAGGTHPTGMHSCYKYFF